jgi:hypothetical protein
LRKFLEESDKEDHECKDSEDDSDTDRLSAHGSKRETDQRSYTCSPILLIFQIITTPVPPFERNLTTGNGFINVSRSCHTIKTQSFSHAGTLKNKKKIFKVPWRSWE